MKKTFFLFLAAIPLLAFGVDHSIRNPSFLARLHYGTSGSTPLIQNLASAWQFEEAFDRVNAQFTNSVAPAELLSNAAGLTYSQLVTNGVSGSSIFLDANAACLMMPDDPVVGMGSGRSFTYSIWWRQNELNDATVGRSVMAKWDLASSARQDYVLRVETNTPVFSVRNLSGTLIEVASQVNTPFNMWIHFACGYDDAQQKIWIQVNGESRKTATCAGVQRSSVPFTPAGYFSGTGTAGSDGGTTPKRDIDELYLWNRSLSEADAKLLISNYYPFSNLRTPGEMIASNWCAQVVVNGGALPGNTTSNALLAFANSGITDGWYGKMCAYNIYAPDNLTAALTPVNGILASQFPKTRNSNAATYWPNGPYKSPWDNHGPFVSGDLNVNGLKPNSSAKWLGSGVGPIWRFDGVGSSYSTFNNSSCGISVYVVEGATGGFDCGTIDGSFSTISAIENAQNNAGVFFCYDFAGGQMNTTNMSSLGGFGFYSNQRTAQNLSRNYYANSTNTFKQYNGDSTGVSAGCLGLSGQMVVFNADDTRLSWPNSQRQSFICFGAGMTLTESSNQYVQVQAMRTTIGGGTN